MPKFKRNTKKRTLIDLNLASDDRQSHCDASKKRNHMDVKNKRKNLRSRTPRSRSVQPEAFFCFESASLKSRFSFWIYFFFFSFPPYSFFFIVSVRLRVKKEKKRSGGLWFSIDMRRSNWNLNICLWLDEYLEAFDVLFSCCFSF